MNKIVINTDTGKHKIDRHIYGHFSEHLGRCIYDGYWVGEESPVPNERGIRKDIVKALKKAKTPNLRWPGGCFADEYHWKDGIGPREERPTMINTHWAASPKTTTSAPTNFSISASRSAANPTSAGMWAVVPSRKCRNG